MGVSKNSLAAVDLGHGRVCKMHLLFPESAVHSVQPDADESVEFSDERLECDCAPSAEDIIIAIEEGDEDFLRKHGLTHLLEGDVDEGTHDFREIEANPFENENRFRNVQFLNIPESIPTPDICDEVCIAERSLPGNPWFDRSHFHHKVTYGPHGERIERYSIIESHGVHGRKPRHAKRVTIRGARVRADIVQGPRGPECVGLVAEPRQQK